MNLFECYKNLNVKMQYPIRILLGNNSHRILYKIVLSMVSE